MYLAKKTLNLLKSKLDPFHNTPEEFKRSAVNLDLCLRTTRNRYISMKASFSVHRKTKSQRCQIPPV